MTYIQLLLSTVRVAVGNCVGLVVACGINVILGVAPSVPHHRGSVCSAGLQAWDAYASPEGLRSLLQAFERLDYADQAIVLLNLCSSIGFTSFVDEMSMHWPRLQARSHESISP